jgi:hypothetical protein
MFFNRIGAADQYAKSSSRAPHCSEEVRGADATGGTLDGCDPSKAKSRRTLFDQFVHRSRPDDHDAVKKIILRKSSDLCARRAYHDGAAVVSHLLNHFDHRRIHGVQMDLVRCALADPFNRRAGQEYRNVEVRVDAPICDAPGDRRSFVVEPSGDEHNQFLLFSHSTPPFFGLNLLAIDDLQTIPDLVVTITLLRNNAIIQQNEWSR